MEQNESLFSLEVDNDTKRNISIAGWWAKFLAVLGFIFIAIMLFALVVASSQIFTVFEDTFGLTSSAIAGVVIIACFLLVALVGAFCYLLFRGASLTRKGVQETNQAIFNQGLAAYRNYFILYGIITILSFLINFIGLFIK